MWRRILTAGAALAALLSLRHFWAEHERAAGLDFYIYFVAGQLANRPDVENVYSAETQERIGEEYFERARQSGSEIRKYDAGRRRRLDNVSSPFLYTTLRWVSRDYERALWQYHVVVLAAFIAAVLLLSRRAGLPWWIALTLVAGLLWLYRGFEADLRVGNVNSLQLFALSVALWSPPILAGAILGMLIAFKPNLIVVALLLALAHDRARLTREVIGGAIGGLIAFTAAAISYGPKSWLQWVSAANQFWHRLPTRGERNVTPFLELFNRYGEWVGYAIAAVLVAAVVVVLRRTKRQDDLLVAGLGILIYLLSATVVWLHYMVLVLPVAIALLRQRVTAVIAIVALLAIAEEPFEWLTKTPIYPDDAKLIGPALIVLFAAGVWMLQRTERRLPDGGAGGSSVGATSSE